MSDILIFADGACHPNPGVGGWGAIVLFDGDSVVEFGGHAPEATNQRMELMAILQALRFVRKVRGNILVYSDSKYCCQAINLWIGMWKRSHWMSSMGDIVKNQDLLQPISAILDERALHDEIVQAKHIPGHAGIPGNDRVDEIAVAYKKKLPIELFTGCLPQYPIRALTDVTPDYQKRDAYKARRAGYKGRRSAAARP